MANLDFAFEMKTASDGSFEGYGSVFNVQDGGNDIIIPGAFSETLTSQKAQGRMPAMLWQHQQDSPIGVYTKMDEDTVGLRVTGKLALKTARGAEAYELLKMGALTGMSIGYRSKEDSYDRMTGIRTLKRLDLLELSLVTFPMNDASRISSVKSAIEELESIRDAERFLRDSGMSRTEAVAFISRVKSLSPRDAGEDDMREVIEAMKAAMPTA